MEGRGVRAFRALVVAICFVFTPVLAVSATDVTQLQQTITEKKAEISSLNARLDQYKAKIRELSGKGASLQNDIALLENEIAMAELDIAATQNAIDQETLELRIIDDQMAQIEKELVARRAMLSDVLFTMNKTDDRGVLDVVLNIGSVGDVFDAAQQLASVNETMKSALEASKLTKQELDNRQADHEAKMASLAAVQRELEVKTGELDSRKNAKVVLASATSESENEYRTLMSEIRSEQQAIASEVASLQDDVQKKLQSINGQTGETSFIWPVHGVMTALFHDPSYPFRNLFEHAGVDIAVPQGTAMKAAAPGIVARVYKGQDYGYYILIIHANGFATLYAHMSRIDVELDQYVSRGEIVGLSGGRPGTVGAGFSTGPHVHFEVRLNGIPVNPLAYLDRSLL
jgi:murein DD-endopeptidase MepM/ murein hydrolase activator NlpD